MSSNLRRTLRHTCGFLNMTGLVKVPEASAGIRLNPGVPDYPNLFHDKSGHVKLTNVNVHMISRSNPPAGV